MMDRSQSRLFAEGQLLLSAAQHGIPHSIEHARGTIDGCFNALVQFEGAEKAFEFACALADRVAGGVKAPTVWPVSAGQLKSNSELPKGDAK